MTGEVVWCFPVAILSIEVGSRKAGLAGNFINPKSRIIKVVIRATTKFTTSWGHPRIDLLQV